MPSCCTDPVPVSENRSTEHRPKSRLIPTMTVAAAAAAAEEGGEILMDLSFKS